MSRVRLRCVLLSVAVVAACSEGTGPQSTATWTSLATGAAHTCGITTGGGAHCWGSNY